MKNMTVVAIFHFMLIWWNAATICKSENKWCF